MSIQIKVAKLRPNAILPRYSHSGPFGDLAADLFTVNDEAIGPGQIKLVRIGLAMEFPPDFGGLIEDRSGLASQGISTLAGVIDPGYRGEISVVVANLGKNDVTFRQGDRIAQIRIVHRIEAIFVETSDVVPTDRGHGGFGSTGS
jgi:dUTP diphosphatase